MTVIGNRFRVVEHEKEEKGGGGVEGKRTVVSDPRTRETHDGVEVVVIVGDDTFAEDAGPITT